MLFFLLLLYFLHFNLLRKFEVLLNIDFYPKKDFHETTGFLAKPCIAVWHPVPYFVNNCLYPLGSWISYSSALKTVYFTQSHKGSKSLGLYKALYFFIFLWIYIALSETTQWFPDISKLIPNYRIICILKAQAKYILLLQQ